MGKWQLKAVVATTEAPSPSDSSVELGRGVPLPGLAGDEPGPGHKHVLHRREEGGAKLARNKRRRLKQNKGT